MSNSPFFIGSRRLGRTSVQEELERHLVPLLRADRAKFLCAGPHNLRTTLSNSVLMHERAQGAGISLVPLLRADRAKLPCAGLSAPSRSRSYPTLTFAAVSCKRVCSGVCGFSAQPSAMLRTVYVECQRHAMQYGSCSSASAIMLTMH